MGLNNFELINSFLNCDNRKSFWTARRKSGIKDFQHENHEERKELNFSQPLENKRLIRSGT